MPRSHQPYRDTRHRAGGAHKTRGHHPNDSKVDGFIGIDGEGKNVARGGHVYTLLASSTGEWIEDSMGLDYRKCFNFLLDIARRRGTCPMVGFSFNYDCEMMLKSIPFANQCELWDTHKTAWNDGNVRWYVERIPSKYIYIQKKSSDGKQSVRVWDCFGFFQMSFVKAIEEWGVASPSEASAILAMKDKRGEFEHVDTNRIRRYCLDECMLLAALMGKLKDAYDRAGIPLRRYDGAGAAAAGLLGKSGIVRDNISYPEMEGIYLSAYYGGRFELFRVGQLGTVYNADINSAYPYAATSIPSMRGMWKQIGSMEQCDEKFSLYKVQWSVDPRERLMPFPHRAKDGSISYPSQGEGWYHDIEVRAAMDCYGTDCIRIHSGWTFVPDSDERPFAFIRDLYRERQRRKSIGDISQLAIKLALNSIYGKLAQGYGWGNKRPTFQNYFWAGLITATTRAQILQAAFPIRDKLVQIATDGIYALEMPDVLHGTGLGEWECGTVEKFFSAQPGVYRCIKDEVIKARNRGFSTREIDFDALETAYESTGVGCGVNFEPTRFLTFGASNKGGRDYAVWRKVKRKLSINFGRKFPAQEPPWLGPQELLPSCPVEYESHPYKPKQSWTDFSDVREYALELDEV